MKYFLEIGGLWLACPKMNIFIEKEDYQQK